MRPIVIKLGGSMAENDDTLRSMASAVAQFANAHPQSAIALVHGGGKDINRHLAWLGEAPTFLEGLRVTSEESLKVVEMTLSGYVNKKLVGYLNAAGAQAVGLSGVDGPTFICEPIAPELGRVGRIVSTQPKLVNHLLAGGYLPVVSPISVDASHRHFNVNADDAAAALAVALNAKRLIYISDVPGVLDAQKQRIARLNGEAIDALITNGIAQGGMIPKLKSCYAAVESGVGDVLLCGFTTEAVFMAQLAGESDSGSVIIP